MQREPLIDALRGLALAGIALPNLIYFTWPPTVASHVFFTLGEAALDRFALFLVAWLAMSKFYPIFAFLFGVGAGILSRKWGSAFRARYRRRLLFLLAVGVLHGVFLWFGDILTLYSVCGLALLYYAPKRLGRVVRALRIWTAITVVLMTFAAIGIATSQWSDYVAPPAAEVDARVDRDRAEAMRVHERLVGDSYWQVTEARARAYASMAASAIAGLSTDIVALFIGGLVVARLGWFRARPANDARWRYIQRIGLGVGLPLNAIVALGMLTLPIFADAFYAAFYLFGPILSAGYVATFVLAWRRGPGWLAALAPVGRMAFTNYLMQSLVFSLVLSGFGLGMARHWDFAALVAFGLAFFVAVQVPLSRWWLTRHEQGPLEALWRRFTYG